MGLPWVRLDTSWHQNPKLLSLVEDRKYQAIAVYVAGLTYSGAQGTDGFIPVSAISLLHGTRRNAAQLVDVGLWIGCPGGWEINDWSEYQQSNAETEERKKRAKYAAELRWARHREQADRID